MPVALDVLFANRIIIKHRLTLGSDFPDTLIFANINLLAAWGLIILLVIGLWKFGSRMPIALLRHITQLLGTIILLSTIVLSLFSWAYSYRIGNVPNSEIIVFLLSNFSQAMRHGMQTMPIALVSFGLIIVLLCRMINRLCAYCRIAEPNLFSPKTMILALLLCGLSITVTGLYTGIPVSLLSINTSSFPKSDETSYVQKEIDWMKHNLPLNNVITPLQGEPTHHVIIIQLESFRRDLAQVQPTPLPFLKSLEPHSLVFDRAYAPASHSNLSDLAIWYSQYPLKPKGKEGYPKNAEWRGTSLFTAMKAAGYATAYISSQNEKWGDMINWLNIPEVDYFFHSEDYKGETWENRDDKAGLWGMMESGRATAGKIEDSNTLKIANTWISQNHSHKPLFLGMNLQNSHFSYVVPPEAKALFQPSVFDFEATYYVWPESKKQIVRNRYFNAVHYMDSKLSEFADSLKRLGIWDNCYFVVLGDSGEAFYEHGFGNHSGPMYEEAMRTFTLIKPPKSRYEIARFEHRPINLIDLPAILLRELGLPFTHKEKLDK